MAKRYTDTDKYKKPFIRSLPGAYKLLWDYLYHSCDHAGIWIVDFEIAQIYLGQDMLVNKNDALKYFNKNEERIIILNEGTKWYIPSFINFQYGELNPKNNVHNSVLQILSKYDLLKNKGLRRVLGDPKDKDKDMDKDKETEIYKRIIDGFYQYHNKKYEFNSKERGIAKKLSKNLVKHTDWEQILKSKVDGLLKKVKDNPKFWAFTIPKLEYGWNEFSSGIKLEEDNSFIDELDMRNKK